MTDFSELMGKTILRLDINQDRDVIRFVTADGDFLMYHSQDCCESVTIDDICGDVADLIGSAILQAEEATNSETDPEGIEPREYRGDSVTWTFYKLATIKGSVTIRWYGSSNGYYSESVSFERAA